MASHVTICPLTNAIRMGNKEQRENIHKKVTIMCNELQCFVSLGLWANHRRLHCNTRRRRGERRRERRGRGVRGASGRS